MGPLQVPSTFPSAFGGAGAPSLCAPTLLASALRYMLNQKDLQLVVEGAGIKLEHLRGDIGPRS